MDSVWEEFLRAGVFHCAVCKELLTTPVWITSDETNLCNDCYEQGKQHLAMVVKNPALTAIVEKLHFPCRYRDKGCREVLAYSDYRQHVQKCPHAQTCLLSDCKWGGTRRELMMHLCEEHADIVLQEEDGAFPISLDDLEIDTINVVQMQSGRFITRIIRTLETLYIVIYNFDSVEPPNVGSFVLQYSSGTKMTIGHECQVCDSISVLKTLELKMATEVTFAPECEVTSVKLIHKSCDTRSVIHKKLLPFFSCYECNKYKISEMFECINGHRTCKECLESCKSTSCICTHQTMPLVEDLKCQECNGTTSRNYWKCANNHCLCENCKHNKKQCQCQTTMTLVKPNIISSELSLDYLFPCRFEALGCKFKGPVSRVHEVNCDYRSVECPVDNCVIQSRLPQLLRHMTEQHTDTWIKDNTHQFVCDFETNNKSMDCFLICCNKFFIHRFRYVKTQTNTGCSSDTNYKCEWKVDEVSGDCNADFLFTVDMGSSSSVKMFNVTYSCGNSLTLNNDAVGDFAEGNSISYSLKVIEKRDLISR